MTYFYVLVFFLNGEADHGIVTKSAQACSDLMGQYLSYDDDMFCWSTGVVSSSIRPEPRPHTPRQSQR